MHKATDKAINRISPELAEALKAREGKLPEAQLKDGKVLCPGCSQETQMPDLGDGISWVEVTARCSGCKTEFTVKNTDTVP